MKNYLIILIFFLTVAQTKKSMAQQDWLKRNTPITTRWSKDVRADKPHDVYPRPQLVRANWVNLNGLWEYSITDNLVTKFTKSDGTILVPFPLESGLSGVKKNLKPDQYLWYRRTIDVKRQPGERLMLHFGAVDWQATVFINGTIVGQHSGGYTSFSFDISDAIRDGKNEIIVKVFDPTNKGFGPHGKQDLDPANIYYTASSGIWQTVWLEKVPTNFIQSFKITTDIDRSEVNIIVNTPLDHQVKLVIAGKTVEGKTNSTIKIPIKNMKLWSPENPYLYYFTATMGKDKVKSYFGMRKISIAKDSSGFDRLMLNNRYVFNLGTLDQGFWPDGLYTAPTDDALCYDIKAIKSMGFNTIRKHIKVEPARWYHYADKIGLIVWQDMVNPNQSLPEGAKQQFERESEEIVTQLQTFPCITTWVLFNEKWGQYDQQRLTKWLKLLDPTRLVNGHSGELLYVNGELRSPSPNAYIGSDFTDVHSYPDPALPEKQLGKAWVCGEFGGVGVPVSGHQWNDITGWGYVRVKPDQLENRYDSMVKQLKVLEMQGLSASIYTQPFDVEGEENGLMTYDREVIKIPASRLRSINSQLIRTQSSPLDKIAKEVDLEDNDDRYVTWIAKFDQGKRDSTFLRRLILMAIRKKDTTAITKISEAYGAGLNEPFRHENLVFLRHITLTTDDFGFNFFLKNKSKINEILGSNEAEAKLTGVITDFLIKPATKNNNPDWEKVGMDLTSRFGDVGEESAWQAAVFNYANNSEWDKFNQLVTVWFPKYGIKRPWIGFGILNRMAWAIFENSTRKEQLEIALMMTAKALEIENHPNVMDTYANILYKLGRRTEALEWENRAVGLAPDNQDIKQNMDKMKKSIPTWPGISAVNFDGLHDLKQILDLAKTKNKNVMLDFMATWCGPCKEMDKYVYSNPEVGAVLNENFINVRIQTDKTSSDSDYVKKWHLDAERLVKKYDITGFPTIVFLDSKGNVIKKIIGEVKSEELIQTATELLH